MLREDSQWHLHSFKTIHWCAEVEILDIHTREFCIFCAEYTVPYYFGGGEIRCSCGELPWVCYQAASCSARTQITAVNQKLPPEYYFSQLFVTFAPKMVIKKVFRERQ